MGARLGQRRSWSGPLRHRGQEGVGLKGGSRPEEERASWAPGDGWLAGRRRAGQAGLAGLPGPREAEWGCGEAAGLAGHVGQLRVEEGELILQAEGRKEGKVRGLGPREEKGFTDSSLGKR